MEEWIKYTRYFLISNLFIFILFFSSCNSDEKNKEELLINESPKEIQVTVMSKEDSLKMIAKKYGINIENDSINVHEILDVMITRQNVITTQLDSLDEKADNMESLAYEYKKKENDILREQLLGEINVIKHELKKIKKIAKENGITIEETKIPEKEVKTNTKSFENLPTGNYVTRIDKHHLLKILVKPNGEILVSQPILDSTTVLKGSRNMSPR